jgi:hypothetical protein
MNDELEGCARKQSWPNLRLYPGICLEALRKPMKTSIMIANLRDLSSRPPNYEAGVLTSQPRRSIVVENQQW